MKKCISESAKTDLPIWFPEIESIDWEKFDYIYNEYIDVILIFKSILTADTSTAVQSCIQLNREIEHQDVNEAVAAEVIPFYIKIINDDSRPSGVLEIIAASLAMLIGNIAWMREEFESPKEPKSFSFLNPGYPRIPSHDIELYNRQSLVLEFSWKNYPKFLERIQSDKSNLYKVHLIELMVDLIVCRRAKYLKVETPFYKETCIAIFDFLDDATCDEHKKTTVISATMKLAKYDLSLIEQLRDWGKEWADLIWVPRTIAFEIAEFENGVYASTEEIALRKTLSHCGIGSHSKYLPAVESSKRWNEWRKRIMLYETGTHAFPILKKILKPPY